MIFDYADIHWKMSESSNSTRQSPTLTIKSSKSPSSHERVGNYNSNTTGTSKTTTTSRKRWQKAITVVKLAKQFQKVRFVVDPKLHEDLDDCPVELEDSTVDESLIFYTDAKTKEHRSFCSKERLVKAYVHFYFVFCVQKSIFRTFFILNKQWCRDLKMFIY